MTSKKSRAPKAKAKPPQEPPQNAPSPLTRAIYARLAQYMERPQRPEVLAAMLRDLAKWRSQLLDNTHRNASGDVIGAGPFAGMIYDRPASEGAALARRLGLYERELHPILAKIIASSPDLILDIGCAEGYYAVGLARACPKARVMARDTNPMAQKSCAALAAKNGVAARVDIGGVVDGAILAQLAGQKAVIICDIEGAEDGLLDPDQHSALRDCPILVEVHDCFAPGLSGRIAARFAASHEITCIDRAMGAADLPDWMAGLSDLDRLLALWEWRSGPTPWLWMTPKAGEARNG